MAVFTNRATLSYNGVTTASNTVTGELIGALTATKTALNESYSADGSIVYVLSLINSGETPIDGLSVTDDLGAAGAANAPLTYKEGSAALFINGVMQAAPQPQSTDPLVFSGLTVPAGGNVLIVYEAEVNGFAPLKTGSEIVNTVSASSVRLSDPVTGSVSVPVSEGPELSIEKSVCPATVMENGTLTYTFVITNTGNAAAGADALITVEDVFSPVLTGVSVTLNGAALQPTTGYTYDELTGEFATAPGVITVPAATFTEGPGGVVGVTPGRATLTVQGTV